MADYRLVPGSFSFLILNLSPPVPLQNLLSSQRFLISASSGLHTQRPFQFGTSKLFCVKGQWRNQRQGCQGGSRERTLPTCGPSLITPKGQRRDPDASDDKKTQKEIKYLAKNLKKLKQCKFLWLSQQGSTPSHLKKYLKMGTGRPPRHTTDLGTLC